MAAAILPPAPGLFSTMTGTPAEVEIKVD